MISCWCFKGSCFVLTFCYIISSFSIVTLVVFFSQKQNVFCLGLSCDF